MGVPQLLSMLLDSAGHNVDLRYYQETHRLTVGVDISMWIYTACQGFGDMLGDERHLTNYGRAELLQEATQNGPSEEQVQQFVTKATLHVIGKLRQLQNAVSRVIVVFDGATPPAKLKTVIQRSQKRKKAVQERDEPIQVNKAFDDDAQERRLRGFKRAGAGAYYIDVIENLIIALKDNKIPFLVAPYEADAQLAFLSQQGYIDLIITEDSDLIAYGSISPIMYKLSQSFAQGHLRGTILRSQDLGAFHRQIDLMDFSTAMFAVMFVAAGGDYCTKLKGIGIVSACRIVREAFHVERNEAPLRTVLTKLFQESWTKDLSVEFREDYERQFLAAVLMFRHPVVYDPIEGVCKTVGLEDPELTRYPPYAALCRDAEKRAKIVGTLLPSPVATYVAEGWIDPRQMRVRPGLKAPSAVTRAVTSYNLPGNEIDEEDEMEELETQEEKILMEVEVIKKNPDNRGAAGNDI